MATRTECVESVCDQLKKIHSSEHFSRWCSKQRLVSWCRTMCTQAFIDNIANAIHIFHNIWLLVFMKNKSQSPASHTLLQKSLVSQPPISQISTRVTSLTWRSPYHMTLDTPQTHSLYFHLVPDTGHSDGYSGAYHNNTLYSVQICCSRCSGGTNTYCGDKSPSLGTIKSTFSTTSPWQLQYKYCIN